jgi:hypothetical protein
VHALGRPENPQEQAQRIHSLGFCWLLVTDRDRVVAEIVPPQPGHQAARHDEFIARGVREGWLTPATAPPDAPMPPRNPVMSFEELMADLERDREDR